MLAIPGRRFAIALHSVYSKSTDIGWLLLLERDHGWDDGVTSFRLGQKDKKPSSKHYDKPLPPKFIYPFERIEIVHIVDKECFCRP